MISIQMIIFFWASGQNRLFVALKIAVKKRCYSYAAVEKVWDENENESDELKMPCVSFAIQIVYLKISYNL